MLSGMKLIAIATLVFQYVPPSTARCQQREREREREREGESEPSGPKYSAPHSDFVLTPALRHGQAGGVSPR
eukprot:COSAG03_NODE_1498_length_3976_cov_7.301780_2_plen_72_part_00